MKELSQKKQQQLKYIDIQRYLLNYLALVRFVFKKGGLRFSFEKKKVTILYYQYNNGNINISVSFDYTKKEKEEIRELIYNIQDFVINCYSEYERQGEQVKLKTLALLTGIGIASIDTQIKKILKKIKKSLPTNMEF